MTRISNMNNVSVRTYGQNSDTLAVIRELKKLGIIKSVAKAKGKSKPKMMDDLKQESDMVGYVKTLEGEPGRGDPNLFALRQIEPGMSEQEIEDIQQRNNAGIAALSAEVQQQRRFIGGLSEAAAGRFGQLESGLADIRSGKFGASSEPTRQSTTIEEIEPDIQERKFTTSINEGGPPAKPGVQTDLFAEGEEEKGIPTSGGGRPLQPVQGIFKEPSKFSTPAIKKRAERGVSLGLGPPPQARNTSEEKTAYYFQLATKEDFEPDSNIKNAKGYLDAINAYLDEDRNFLST